MKKIITFMAVLASAVIGLNAQVLTLNLGDDSMVVKQKLYKLGFTMSYDGGSEAEYTTDKSMESEDGILVNRVHLGFKGNKLACVNVDHTDILSPAMCAIAYHDYLRGKGDWSLERLDKMSGEARRWRMFENTLILGNNQRWRNYSLLTIANSSRGLLHTELYFTDGPTVVGVEWYDDSVTLSWGTAEFFGLD